MKFESKVGVGEIVSYEPHIRGDKDGPPVDSLLEVQGVYFGMDGKIEVICRYPRTGVTVSFSEDQLLGDPDYDQDAGKYNDD